MINNQIEKYRETLIIGESYSIENGDHTVYYIYHFQDFLRDLSSVLIPKSSEIFRFTWLKF